MDAITEQEKKDIRAFLVTIYGEQARKWDINFRVLELFGELLQSSDTCSKYMDSVPRPYYFGNTIKWASKQVRQAIVRHLKKGGKQYLVCLRAAGLSKKSDFVIAASGA